MPGGEGLRGAAYVEWLLAEGERQMVARYGEEGWREMNRWAQEQLDNWPPDCPWQPIRAAPQPAAKQEEGSEP